jgi:uncharacterized protein
MNEQVAVGILAKAPVAGFAKTRLVVRLGAEGAASIAARLIARAVDTACRSGVGPVTLWATPDEQHPLFQSIRTRYGLALRPQSGADLGARMCAAMAAARGPALVIGTDCPALTPDYLRMGADVLRRPCDAVLFPAEDGGYALIGLRAPRSAIFEEMPWGTSGVLGKTRCRLKQLGLSWREPITLWDVDLPEDLDRLSDMGLADLVADRP